MVADGAPHDDNSFLSRVGTRCGMGSLLAFFSTRVLRGGPKILLYLATCLVLLLVVIKVLPAHLNQEPFGSKSIHFLDWTGDKNDDETQQGETTDGGDASGGATSGPLRIVVFGENDIATPSQIQELAGSKKHRAWTELLCEELGCSNYISFVPTFDNLSRSMASNELYATSLDRALNETEPSNGPAFDYSFLADQYPVPWQLPDLSNQVTAFLSMEKPAKPPAETLWVLSFGTWDVWSLAAMPKNVSTHVVELMVGHIFTEVERLYQSSLNENSVAWSNSSALNASGATDGEVAGGSTLPPGSDAAYSPDGFETGKEPGLGGFGDNEATGARAKHFRIIVPKLFDSSLAPGWLSARPDAPKVHSKAEQLRNAVALTDLWNSYVNKLMGDWVGTPDPVGGGWETQNLEETKPQQYPLRDAIAYDLPSYLMEMLVEGQLHSSGVNDSTGTGTRPANQTFAEVRSPCVIKVSKPSGEGEAPEGVAVATPVATGVESKASPTPPSVRRRAGTTTSSSASSDSPPPPAMEVCDTPREHLFFTPFTLSQRAIADIAGQAALMVRRNETVRARWQAAADLAAAS